MFWTWIGAAASVAFAAHMNAEAARDGARLLAFGAIALGGLLCLPAGALADRIGKARVAQGAMVASGLAGLGAALAFGGPPWLFALLVLIWGATIIPDSAQFSALVADAAPPERAGSLMTFQTALGLHADVLHGSGGAVGCVRAGLAPDPGAHDARSVAGIVAMQRLIRVTRDRLHTLG